MIDAYPAHLLARPACPDVGLSRFQLHRGFLREFRLPPHLYILPQRIALARQLLKSGHSPVEAALSAGFCDQSHLNRVFKQTFGVPPGQYR